MKLSAGVVNIPPRLIKFNSGDNRVVLCNWIFSAPELLGETAGEALIIQEIFDAA